MAHRTCKKKEMKPTNDIPIEGVLKWLKHERDELQWKLDQLIPYTKSLEKKVDSLEKSLAGCRKQLSEAVKEVTKNDIYKALNKRYALSQRDNKDLLRQIGSLHRKLDQYAKTK